MFSQKKYAAILLFAALSFVNQFASAQMLPPIFNSEYAERFRNGTIHQGTFGVLNQRFPGYLIDNQDPQAADPNYVGVIRLNPPSVREGRTPEWTWSQARATCRSLGEGWDLPTYDRRFQVVSNQRYALPAGTVATPAGRETVYALWLRNPTEAENKGDKLEGENKNWAYVVSLNESRNARETIPARYFGRTLLADGGIAFIDLVFKLGSEADAKHLQYQTQQTPAARASLAVWYANYFARLRSLQPAVLQEIQSLCDQGNQDACVTFALKNALDNYLRRYGNQRVQGFPGCNTLGRCLEAAARAQDMQTLTAIINSDWMVNWWESFPEDRQFRNHAGTFFPALIPVWQDIQNWAQTGKLGLYCAKEFPKTGR